jgi:hypothetical protein
MENRRFRQRDAGARAGARDRAAERLPGAPGVTSISSERKHWARNPTGDQDRRTARPGPPARSAVSMELVFERRRGAPTSGLHAGNSISAGSGERAEAIRPQFASDRLGSFRNSDRFNCNNDSAVPGIQLKRSSPIIRTKARGRISEPMESAHVASFDPWRSRYEVMPTTTHATVTINSIHAGVHV